MRYEKQKYIEAQIMQAKERVASTKAQKTHQETAAKREKQRAEEDRARAGAAAGETADNEANIPMYSL